MRQPAKVASLSNDASNIIIDVEAWIHDNYDLKKNVISRHIESDGEPMNNEDINSLYISVKKVFPRVKFDDVYRIICSNSTHAYNPFLEFFNKHSKLKPTGLIDSIADTLCTDDYEFCRYFIRKWLVGVISSIYGQHSRIMLILAGKQKTGKTEWFRRLLPDQLKSYYTEISAGMKDTDFNIMMTQKLIIMDDEFEAKRKKEETALKALLSKQVFTVREPFGRMQIDLKRLAVLCGTSNEDTLLSDTTGNTRFVPIAVFSVNHADYNNIDKTALWMEVYNLYHAGFDWRLTNEDTERLEAYCKKFENYTMEYELILKLFTVPGDGDFVEELTATDIKNKMETHTVQKLNIEKIGKELKRCGFEQVISKRNGKAARLYRVKMVTPVTLQNY